jgi:hypothetical protein
MHVAEVGIERRVLSLSVVLTCLLVPIVAAKKFPPKVIDGVVPSISLCRPLCFEQRVVIRKVTLKWLFHLLPQEYLLSNSPTNDLTNVKVTSTLVNHDI